MEDDVLDGVMVPDRYLDMERNLLESMLQLNEAKKAYRKARNKMVGMMKKDGIRKVVTNTSTICIFPISPERGNGMRLIVNKRKKGVP